jgi:L-aminopeptidase/D-esterase-like protein
MRRVFLLAPLLVLLVAAASATADEPAKPRARDLGVPFDGTPGPLNAITDIKGVEVGFTTLVAGEGVLKVGAGPVAEGNFGGGTGMICYGFKGGTGTASRTLPEKQRGYSVGVLVQANHGGRQQLLIAGVPVGREISDAPAKSRNPSGSVERGSIIIIVATDAPLLPHQLKRLARRAALGLARTGGAAGNGSGDLFLAFSTANADAAAGNGPAEVHLLRNDTLDGLFGATIQATEEAIINVLIAAETMTGRDGHRVAALPHDRLREVLKKYNRLVEGKK